MVKVHEYLKAKTGTMYVSGQGVVTVGPIRDIYGYGLNGKYAVLGTDSAKYNIERAIRSWSYLSRITPNLKVFLSSKSKLPRDLVRNSGYTITWDFDDPYACIAIPKINNETVFNPNIVVYDAGVIILFYIRSSDAYVNTDYFSHMEDMKIALMKRLNVSEDSIYFPSADNFKQKVCFISKVPEYKTILEGDTAHKYIFDYTLPLKPGTDMSVESLEIMAHLQDETLLAKTILNADWQNYPFSIMCMLHYTHPTFSVNGDAQCRVALEGIGYLDYLSRSYDKLFVSPEDWKMSQEWIFHHYAISESKVYKLNRNRIYGIDLPIDFLRLGLIAKPVEIPTTLPLSEILNLI